MTEGTVVSAATAVEDPHPVASVVAMTGEVVVATTIAEATVVATTIAGEATAVIEVAATAAEVGTTVAGTVGQRLPSRTSVRCHWTTRTDLD